MKDKVFTINNSLFYNIKTYFGMLSNSWVIFFSFLVSIILIVDRYWLALLLYWFIEAVFILYLSWAAMRLSDKVLITFKNDAIYSQVGHYNRLWYYKDLVSISRKNTLVKVKQTKLPKLQIFFNSAEQAREFETELKNRVETVSS